MMKTTRSSLGATLTMAAFVIAFNTATAGELGPVIDDFSDPNRNALGIERHFVDDSSAGGQTRTEHRVEKGVLSTRGEISPPRGQPGWASTVLLLDPQGQARDASSYEGIRLLVRINAGNLSVSANSAEITNFDFHAAPITRQPDNEFHEVKIPFGEMKRAWSEQVPLDARTLTSVSLVAFGLQKEPFDFEVGEVSFY